MSFPRYPKYKDSGVEWLGEVPEHWEVKSLRHCFSIVGGTTPDSRNSEFWDGDISWVTPSDLEYGRLVYIYESKRTITHAGLASCGLTLVPAGSIVLSTRAPIGSVGINRVEVCTNQGCKSLLPKSGVASRYFGYLLSANHAELNIRGKGTTFLELSGDALASFTVLTPGLEEQLQIAMFLDRETAKIDALVGEQRRLIELLKEKRQAVISHAVTKGLNPDVPMKPSGIDWLGDVPAHWEVRSLAMLSNKITNGYVGPTRGILVESGIRYLQSLHIKNNQIRFDAPYYVTEEWSRAHAKSILEAGDVLIVQTGDIGQVAVVSDEFAGCNCHALIIVSPRRDHVAGDWISWVLNSNYGNQSLLSIQTGALHPHLNCGNVKFIRLPVPPLSEQYRIVTELVERLSEFDQLIEQCQRAIELLQERRTALISAAVTGKIDVRGLAAHVEAA